MWRFSRTLLQAPYLQDNIRSLPGDRGVWGWFHDTASICIRTNVIQLRRRSRCQIKSTGPTRHPTDRDASNDSLIRHTEIRLHWCERTSHNIYRLWGVVAGGNIQSEPWHLLIWSTCTILGRRAQSGRLLQSLPGRSLRPSTPKWLVVIYLSNGLGTYHI